MVFFCTHLCVAGTSRGLLSLAWPTLAALLHCIKTKQEAKGYRVRVIYHTFYYVQREPLSMKNGGSGIPKPSRLLQPGTVSALSNRKRPAPADTDGKEVSELQCTSRKAIIDNSMFNSIQE